MEPINITRAQLLEARLKNSSIWLSKPASAKIEQLDRTLSKTPSKMFSPNGQAKTNCSFQKKNLNYSSAEDLSKRVKEVMNTMSLHPQKTQES